MCCWCCCVVVGDVVGVFGVFGIVGVGDVIFVVGGVVIGVVSIGSVVSVSGVVGIVSVVSVGAVGVVGVVGVGVGVVICGIFVGVVDVIVRCSSILRSDQANFFPFCLSQGINVRLLGYLYTKCPQKEQALQQLIQLEMLMRATKSVLRGVLRHFATTSVDTSEEDTKTELLVHLNYILGKGLLCDLYFEAFIKLAVLNKFGVEMTEEWKELLTPGAKQLLFRDLAVRLGISTR